MTLLSYYNPGHNYKIIAPKIKNTANYDVDIYNKRLKQEEFRDLTYISSNPIGITGDQSFIDALLLGKVCYYDKPPWKEHMIEELILLLRENKLNILADWYEYYDTENMEATVKEAEEFADILFETNLDTYDKITKQIKTIFKHKKGGKRKTKRKRKGKKIRNKKSRKTNK